MKEKLRLTCRGRYWEPETKQSPATVWGPASSQSQSPHRSLPAISLHMRAQSLQSCPTLCNPMACGPPGSAVHEIFQARIPEWVTISFSRESSQPRDQTPVSCTAGRFFTKWATKEAQWVSWLAIIRMCMCVLSSVRLCDPINCSPPGSSGHKIFPVEAPKIRIIVINSDFLHQLERYWATSWRIPNQQWLKQLGVIFSHDEKSGGRPPLLLVWLLRDGRTDVCAFLILPSIVTNRQHIDTQGRKKGEGELLVTFTRLSGKYKFFQNLPDFHLGYIGQLLEEEEEKSESEPLTRHH